MKVLTLKFKDDMVEIHMLNPGETFAGFGGSRHPLVVVKDASLVLRRRTATDTQDIELEIHDHGFWLLIGEMLNGTRELPNRVDIPEITGDI